jgi:hypothetical protein
LPEKAKRGGDDGVLCIASGRVETREELRSNRKEVMAATGLRNPCNTQIMNITNCDNLLNALRNTKFVVAVFNALSRAHVNKSGSHSGEAPGNHHRSRSRFKAHAQNVDMLVNRLNMTELAYLVVAHIT